MKNQMQIFENTEFGKIRVITIDGQPWFVGKDITDILGYTNSRKALIDHVDAEDKNTVTIRDGIPGNPNKTIVNESGLYSLILSSKLPQAKAFKRWVTAEVLPTVRKHGAYATSDTLDDMLRNPKFAEALIRKLAAEREKTAALEDLAEELAPKALYCDLILQSKNAVPVSLIAKDYGMSATAFNRLLYGFTIQYPVAGTWLLYQEYAGRGYTHTRTYRVNDSTSAMHTCWTQKGRLFLYETLKSCGILPLIEKAESVNWR
jgi:Prophage antirepressor